MGFNCYSNSFVSSFLTFNQRQIKNEVNAKFSNIKVKKEEKVFFYLVHSVRLLALWLKDDLRLYAGIHRIPYVQTIHGRKD
jgi:hypothetical protein